MDVTNFIDCAERLSTKIITEVSLEDVLMLKTIKEKYPTFHLLVNNIMQHNALDLAVTLYSKRAPCRTVFVASDPLTINALILLLFVTNSKRLKRDVEAYLRSLENPSVDAILNKY
jgi:hypothetical protein